jgi:hypothetical protein
MVHSIFKNEITQILVYTTIDSLNAINEGEYADKVVARA